MLLPVGVGKNLGVEKEILADAAVHGDDEPDQSRPLTQHRAVDRHRKGGDPPLPRAPEGSAIGGEVLAGGHPVGQRYVVLFMEAESEDELHEMLGGLPLSELGDTTVTELKSFEELQHPQRAPRAASYRDRLP
jgi:hypothetical protein